MHWLDAGEKNDVEETVIDDAEEGMRGTNFQTNSPRTHRKEENGGIRRGRVGQPKNVPSPGVKKNVRSDLSCAMLPLVPLPFPPQWHTQKDDLDHVSLDMVMNFHVLFTTFLFFSPA